MSKPIGDDTFWKWCQALKNSKDHAEDEGRMTFRELLTYLNAFISEHPDHESLDRQVIVRVGVPDDDDDEIHIGGLRSANVDAGCTDDPTLVLDADQDVD